MAKKDYSNWSKTELIKEVRKLEKRKKYGIVWEDKPEKVAELCKEKLPVLAEDKGKEIKTDNKKPINILIEGDNYHALSVMNYTHKGKIDIIYIDPPYNTGKKDEWKYNDKYVDSEDLYKHSKWLSFIDKRLRLAKNLLSKRGIIIISTDDNEGSQLKILCDEIFGEKNFIGDIIWNSTKSVTNTALISVAHTYNWIYAKSKDYYIKNRTEFRLPEPGEGFSNPDNDPRGPWKADPFQVGGWRPNQQYEIVNPKTNKKYKPNKGCSWKNDYKNFQKLLKDNRIVFGSKGEAGPQRKRFLYEAKERGRVTTTIWNDVDTTTNATVSLKKLFGLNVFNNPKPVSLIKRFIQLAGRDDSIVLDFFAGSGTTGHAVLELNKEDNRNRKCILCTDNENNICTEVCYPRIKKAIKGYKNMKGIKSNFKYFKTGFVDAEPTDKNKRKLVDKSTEMLCLKEDCFDEGKKGKNFKIFKNSQDKYLGIIYDDDGIEPFKKEVKKLDKKFIVYVFSLDESAREEEFEDMADLVELKPIPAVILNVYRRIFK